MSKVDPERTQFLIDQLRKPIFVFSMTQGRLRSVGPEEVMSEKQEASLRQQLLTASEAIDVAVRAYMAEEV